MGVLVGHCNTRHNEVTRLKHICQPRLALLRKVAWGDVGSSVPVLKRLCVSLVRSVIDYSSSTLTRLNKGKSKALEVIQNTAIRIILGCPRSTQQDSARHEIGLPPRTHRVQQMAALQIMRSLNTNDDGQLYEALFNPKWKEKCNVWLSSVRKLLSSFNFDKYMDDREHKPVDLPPWELPVFNVSYFAIKVKKCNVPCELMRQDFLSRLNALPYCPNILYTDGSLHEDGRAGAGVCL
ncbi:hypothetical protein GWK47_053768 [Chionoecetes opilio]|uniref:Uncharacterized protein n=1 Tax=Chionoecetes opilio TaxID=41210 RepID=A0A8J4Y6R1_CHIOP|nr:hypothetical protein GWK47_053768 [Chionoecetes opilio]